MFVTEFHQRVIIENYPAVVDKYDWVELTPPSSIKKEHLPFLKTIKVFKPVKHDFQEDVNKEYLITPEMVVKSGITFDKKDVHYSSAEDMKLNKMNAQEIRDYAKTKTQADIYKTSQEATDKEIQAYLEKKRLEFLAQHKKNNDDGKDVK